MTKKLILIFTAVWWGWTALIDFAVVPTIFRIVPDFFTAGELGIALFSKLNLLELTTSSILVVLAVIQVKNEKRGKIQLGLIFSAWIIVMIYFSFLTQKITDLTALWKKADSLNTISILGIVDIQQEHQFYHRVYVGLDVLKLLLLSFVMGLSLFRKEGINAKA